MCYLKVNKAVIVFSSKGNSAKTVAMQILKNSNDNVEILNLNENFILAQNFVFDFLILVCPTYGDEELEITMENFLVQSDWSIHENKKFAVCELGLYRGYKETQLGAGIIIINFLNHKNLSLIGNLLSLDSLPLVDFTLINKWSSNLSEILNRNI